MNALRQAIGTYLVIAGLVSVASPAAAQHRASESRPFGVDVAAASVGSATGLLVGLAISSPDDCVTDDIECIPESLGTAALLSAITAPAAVMLAGRWRGPDPSIIGLTVGSVIGIAASVGVLKLLEESMDGDLSRPLAVVTFSVPHGLVTALGGRAGRALGAP